MEDIKQKTAACVVIDECNQELYINNMIGEEGKVNKNYFVLGEWKGVQMQC